jgi:hypothetical protein
VGKGGAVMTDSTVLNFEMLERARMDIKARIEEVPAAFVVTPLFNFMAGYWQVPYQGRAYILLGRIGFARLVSEIPLATTGTALPGDGIVTLHGIPIVEDEELARTLIMTALELTQQAVR